MERPEYDALVTLRRELHQLAEPSGAEERTAGRIDEALDGLEVIRGLGGHGRAVVVHGAEAGPTVLVRADMDALPIDETLPIDHASLTPGYSHKCGHDGHLAMLVGLTRRFASRPPVKGRFVALFQPAEETGHGARAVLDSPAFAPLRPDAAIALHNFPRTPTGSVLLRSGPLTSAARSLEARFTGTESHAAEPEAGRSPALAVSQVIGSWTSIRQTRFGFTARATATITHARVGRPCFGTSPGEGCVMATLRASDDALIGRLEDEMRTTAEGLARAHGLEVEFDVPEVFPAVVNDEALVELITSVAHEQSRPVIVLDDPLPHGEDFGHFREVAPIALFGLGSGEDQPPLHDARFDFPDGLIPVGVELMEAVVRRRLGEEGG